MPPGQPGLFYYGPDALQVPFGDGFRCVGGGVTRLDVVLIDSFATAMFALDLAGLPPAGSPIDPGSTWRFQFWYRDPQGGPAGFNLTDALAVTFCD